MNFNLGSINHRQAGIRNLWPWLLLLLTFSIMTVAFPQLAFLHHGRCCRIATKPLTYQTELEGIRLVGQTGNVIDDEIYYVGGYELYTLHALRDFLLASDDDTRVFLDIGANIGQHSLYMSQYATEVISIEPFPPVLERFQGMVAQNDTTNIRIYPVGYSNAQGSLPFYAPPQDNHGLGSFNPSWSQQTRLVANLPLVVGDKHLAEQGIGRVDLIKIDIEGFERYALKGLGGTLRKWRPTVVLELNATQGGFQSKDQLLDTFPDAYEFWYLGLDLPKGVAPLYTLKFGSYVYVYGPAITGDYTLSRFDFSFQEHALLVAVPKEKGGNFF